MSFTKKKREEGVINELIQKFAFQISTLSQVLNWEILS